MTARRQSYSGFLSDKPSFSSHIFISPILDANIINYSRISHFFALNCRLLRESGGNTGPVTVGIATEICVAASNNDVALLESWNLAGISLNVRNATRRTPLHEAVCALCKESVDYLLSRDVDVNMRDNLGHTALDNALRMQTMLSNNLKCENEKRKIVSAIITSFVDKGLLRNDEQIS